MPENEKRSALRAIEQKLEGCPCADAELKIATIQGTIRAEIASLQGTIKNGGNPPTKALIEKIRKMLELAREFSQKVADELDGNNSVFEDYKLDMEKLIAQLETTTP